ncbi:hypothetical protein ANTPLA_LOCUS4551 [Anthophora plagiata]
MSRERDRRGRRKKKRGQACFVKHIKARPFAASPLPRDLSQPRKTRLGDASEELTHRMSRQPKMDATYFPQYKPRQARMNDTTEMSESRKSQFQCQTKRKV